MESNFNNKVVWITGASSGIGEALVKLFAQQKAKIILSARRENELKRIVADLKIPESNYLIIPFDLKDTSNANNYVTEILNKFGSIDILINNGGYSQRSEVKDTPINIDRELMEVNYFSIINLTKSVLPQMLKQRSGQIVVISSIAGKFGFYLRSSYSAAKHALHGFFESFRLETEKQGIKTLIVCPGKIKTNISFSAVTADGKKHNRMDESHVNAMSADTCAEIILKAITQNKEEIFVGGKELKALWLKKYIPGVFKKIIRKQSPY